MCSRRGDRHTCISLALLATCFCLFLQCSLAGDYNYKRVNCRKFVFAPICRGAVKRAMPVMLTANSVGGGSNDARTFVDPRSLARRIDNHRIDWKSLRARGIKDVNTIYDWVRQNKRIRSNHQKKYPTMYASYDDYNVLDY